MADIHYDLSSTEVLIVDDIPSARKILVRILKKLGCKNIIECGNGKEVLEATKNSPSIGLIISDREMPDLSGIDILKALRATTEFHGLPFVLISSSVSHDDIKRVGELGHAEILLKPFSSSSLSEKLSALSPRKNEAQDSPS